MCLSTGRPLRGWGRPAVWPRRLMAGPRTRSLGGGDYSRISAYEPMARAMSAWAQNRW